MPSHSAQVRLTVVGLSLFGFAVVWSASLAAQDAAEDAAGIAKKLSAAPVLTELSLRPLQMAEEEVRKEFFESLAKTKISEPNRMAIAAHMAKKDPSPEVRLAAARNLVPVKDNKLALATMSVLLADKSPDVRMLACTSLTGFRGDPTLGPKFSKLMFDPSSDVRGAAVRALGKLNDRLQVPHVIAAYKKFKTGGDEDVAFGEALAGMGETDVSLEIARNCLKSRNQPVRLSAVTILEYQTSPIKVVPIIMDNLVLELRRTIAMDPRKPNWDAVYVGMCVELGRRVGSSYGNDAVGWSKWWQGVREKYKAPAPAFDAEIVGRWMEQYRSMGPSPVRQ